MGLEMDIGGYATKEIARPFRYHILKYPLLVDLMKISFSSVCKVVAFGAEGMGFDHGS